MQTTKHTLSVAAVLCLVSTRAFAQESLFLTDVVATPQFFVCLLAGLLLAIGFQVLLTALSAAIGITAIGNLEKQANKPASGDSNSDDSDTSLGVKISSGVGLWTLITASVALFFAALLAVKLSLVGNAVIGVTLGLVIWAAFFTTLAYLEIKSVSTLLGSLISLVISGVKSSASAVQSIFQGSPYGNIEDIANHTVEKIRAELEDAVDLNQISLKIDEYVRRMEESGPDYERVKHDMIDLLTDIRIEEKKETGSSGSVDTETFIKLASEQSNVSKKEAEKLGNAFQEAQQAVEEGDGKEEQAKKVVANLSGKKEEEITRYVQQIEEYLRSTDQEEVNPDAIRDDIEQMIKDPSHAQSIITDRAKQFDRSTWVALLEKDKRMNHDRAETVVSYVEQAINFVAGKVDSAQEKVEEEKGAVAARTNEARAQSGSPTKQTTSKAESRIKSYLDGMERPELQYDSLKQDVLKVLDDPKTAPQVIKRRLEKFDRETLMALLTSNDRLSRKDVEGVTQRIDESKQQVLTKVDEIERKTESALEGARQAALHQAENARKTAASAAWWLFATAVASGAAAALGGWIAIT